MVLYPQLYSTVNQNQIHLHLHGSDKLEQYFTTPENALTISSISGVRGFEIGIGTAENPLNNIDLENDEVDQSTIADDVEDNRESIVVGDPSSVWRPY